MNTNNQAGVKMIAQERQRQIDVEKWDLSHDADYSQGELIGAAGCYIANALSKHLEGYRQTNQSPLAKFQVYYNDKKTGWGDGWPWNKKWDKRKKHDKLRSLVIAGALIAAEIDRLNPEPPSQPAALPSAEAVSDRLVSAAKGILEIGNRDMSNPKYDGYFTELQQALEAAHPPTDAAETIFYAGRELTENPPDWKYKDFEDWKKRAGYKFKESDAGGSNNNLVEIAQKYTGLRYKSPNNPDGGLDDFNFYHGLYADIVSLIQDAQTPQPSGKEVEAIAFAEWIGQHMWEDNNPIIGKAAIWVKESDTRTSPLSTSELYQKFRKQQQ